MQQLEAFLSVRVQILMYERHPFQTFFIGLQNNIISILGVTSHFFGGKHVLNSNYFRKKRLTNTMESVFQGHTLFSLNFASI